MSRLAFATLAALVGSAPSNAAEPHAPSGQWVVTSGASQCLASRAYGTAAKPIRLVLKPSPQGTVVRLAITRPGTTPGVFQRDARLRVDTWPEQAVSVLAYSAGGLSIQAVNLAFDRPDLIAGATDLAITGEQIRARFVLSEMAPMMQSLQACLARLQDEWNVGAPRAVRIAKGPAGTALGALFAAGDYPPSALRKKQQGASQFTILIDESGAVRDCTIDRTSGFAALDAQACYMIRTRARFTPARDADGKPVKSSITQTVRWVLQ